MKGNLIMKSVLFYMVIILLFNNIYAEQVTIFQNSQQTVVRYINSSGNFDYTYSILHSIGRHDGNNGIYSGSQNDIWRSQHSFPLGSIPSNATITQAQLQFFVGSYQCSTCSLKVTKTTGQGSYGQLWSNINNSNTIVSSYRYDSGTPVVSTALKDAIVASLSSGTLYLGSLSLVEGENMSYASLELRLIVDYTVPPSNVSITADNNFTAAGGSNHGTMVIDGVNQTIPLTGYTFQKTVGQTLTLSANSPQNDNQAYQRIWHTGATNTSDWRRNNVFRSYSQTYSFPVTADDNGKIYVANLRKNYAISRNDQTEFDGTISAGVVAQIVEQNSGQISAPSQHPINNLYNFFGWTDGNGDNPRIIWPDNNQTYTALYKMVHKSNDETAYSNNSQRKFIRTPDGYYHHVYESMNDVWYERSTNNGQSWEIVFSTFPRYSNFLKCTQPNLTYYVDNQGNTHVYLIFVIVDPTGDRIPMIEFVNDNYNVTERYVENYPIESGRKYMNPIAACSKNGEIFCAWETKLNNTTFPLQYAYGKNDLNGYINWYNSGSLNFTSSGAEKPAVSFSQDVNDLVIHLSWQ